MVHKNSYYIINAITFYRLIATPVLLVLLLYHQLYVFKWLLLISFSTDAIDGYLARKLKTTSYLGSIIDSIADDLTVGIAILGIILTNLTFLISQLWLIIPLLLLYIIQVVSSLLRYGKISSFHTYTAKAAAIAQGIFLILFYFLPQPVYPLFYIAMGLTMIDLLEEIVLVGIIREWQTDVKGLYWLIKKRNGRSSK